MEFSGEVFMNEFDLRVIGTSTMLLPCRAVESKKDVVPTYLLAMGQLSHGCLVRLEVPMLPPCIVSNGVCWTI